MFLVLAQRPSQRHKSNPSHVNQRTIVVCTDRPCLRGVPLICPHSGGQMRIIAFVTFNADIQKILDHIGVDTEAPRITPACQPPLWEGEVRRRRGRAWRLSRIGIRQTNHRLRSPCLNAQHGATHRVIGAVTAQIEGLVA